MEIIAFEIIVPIVGTAIMVFLVFGNPIKFLKSTEKQVEKKLSDIHDIAKENLRRKKEEIENIKEEILQSDEGYIIRSKSHNHIRGEWYEYFVHQGVGTTMTENINKAYIFKTKKECAVVQADNRSLISKRDEVIKVRTKPTITII